MKFAAFVSWKNSPDELFDPKVSSKDILLRFSERITPDPSPSKLNDEPGNGTSISTNLGIAELPALLL